MLAIQAEIGRHVDASFSGSVECAFVDASGVEHMIVEKVPAATTEAISTTSAFPRPCPIACTLMHEPVGLDNGRVSVVDTASPWGVESAVGRTRFEVLRTQALGLEGHPPAR